MSIQNLIILSQLNPPAQGNQILIRKRVNDCLLHALDYPVTVLVAGTGYGKSTAILSFLKSNDHPVYWFTISGSDRDPKLFLAKIFSAFNQSGQDISGEALEILDLPESTYEEALIAFLNGITKGIVENSFLILDDFHRVSDLPEILGFIDWIIENLPPNLHIIIATRSNPDFPSINKWRVKGRIFEIGRETLVFTQDEVGDLYFNHYGLPLDRATISQMLQKTEGWAIGIQMIWQSLQNNPGMSIHQVLVDDRYSKTALFDYLAEEVLSGYSQEVQNFLVTSAILSKLDCATCDFLLNIDNSDVILRDLMAAGLFIEELRPGVYRFHHIFREFLITQLHRKPEKLLELHRKIASYFNAHEYWEEAIYHLLVVGDYRQVNLILENIGQDFIQDGRQESINYWIHEIPENIWDDFPYLIYLLGEVNRFLGDFEQSLEYYHRAERSYRKQNDQMGIALALRGQGQVFLDTIRPTNADQLLQDALKILEPLDVKEDVSDLLVLTAENQLNLGYPESAEKLLVKANSLRSHLDMETDFIQARIYLRTGRLKQGVDLLHAREADNPIVPPARPQRFHREATLLLSLFYAIMGDSELAEKYARQGIEIGKLLKSKFVQSVGCMRLGHALMLQSRHPFDEDAIDEPLTLFNEAIEKVDIVRIHVEPLWGMCRALGYHGRIKDAEQYALEALKIAKKAGDEWISILIQLSIGSAFVLAGEYENAQSFLTTAETLAIKVKDPFTLCAARLWLAIRAWHQNYQNTAFGYLEKLLLLVREHGYEFLLHTETLLGLNDRDILIPLLLAARDNNIERSYIQHLLRSRELQNLTYHPGYSIWVQTFGRFKVWRGDQLIEPQDWKREKAKQLFQLLVANRDKWLHRDQIINILWEDTPDANALNYLKVIVNTMNQVLEPDRPKGKSSFFVERRQERYRLNPKANIIIDTDLFIEHIRSDSVHELEKAMMLYQGRYFKDSYIQEWLTIENHYYHQQFLLGAQKLVEKLVASHQLEMAMDITYKILGEDQLWEAAYRMQMELFHKMGRHALVRKVYNQCQEVLKSELDAPLSQKTVDLFEEITADS